MIQTLPIDGGDLIALQVSDRLTHADYRDTIVPRLENALREHERVRCLVVLGPDGAGITPTALWDELKLDFAHRKDFERVALVTDDVIVRTAARLVRPLFRGDVRIFSMADQAEAQRWIQEGRLP
jgi:hypothetical protein